MSTTVTKPSTARKPADRKSKASAGFTFVHDGATFAIPAPAAAYDNLPGQVFRDAIMGGDEGEMRLGFVLVEASGIEADALAALYAKPIAVTFAILREWMASADPSGATLPQS